MKSKTIQPIDFSQPREQPLSMSQVAELELDRRQKAGKLASIDTMLAAKSIIAVQLLEEGQTEMQSPDYVDLVDMDGVRGFIFEDLPRLPLDWKAMGAAAGAYIATNAVKRIRDHQNYGQELEDTMTAIAGAESVVPHTRKSLKRYQRKQKAKRAATTVVAMGAAYKMGVQLDTVGNMVAGASIGSTGIISSRVIDKVRSVRRSGKTVRNNRVRNTTVNTDNGLPAYAVTHNSALQPEYEPDMNPSQFL